MLRSSVTAKSAPGEPALSAYITPCIGTVSAPLNHTLAVKVCTVPLEAGVAVLTTLLSVELEVFSVPSVVLPNVAIT